MPRISADLLRQAKKVAALHPAYANPQTRAKKRANAEAQWQRRRADPHLLAQLRAKMSAAQQATWKQHKADHAWMEACRERMRKMSWAYHAERKAGHPPGWAPGRIELHCATCGTSFFKPPSVAKLHPRHFCSRACFAKWKTVHHTGQNHPAWKGKVTVRCEHCGTALERYPYQVKRGNRHFCNLQCNRQWLAARKHRASS